MNGFLLVREKVPAAFVSSLASDQGLAQEKKANQRKVDNCC